MPVNTPNNTTITVNETQVQIYMDEVMQTFYHVTFSVTLWIYPGQMENSVTLSKCVDFSGLNKITKYLTKVSSFESLTADNAFSTWQVYIS